MISLQHIFFPKMIKFLLDHVFLDKQQYVMTMKLLYKFVKWVTPVPKHLLSGCRSQSVQILFKELLHCSNMVRYQNSVIHVEKDVSNYTCTLLLKCARSDVCPYKWESCCSAKISGNQFICERHIGYAVVRVQDTCFTPSHIHTN